MTHFSILQEHIRTLQPFRTGVGRSIALPIEGITDYDQMKRLMEAGEDAGHGLSPGVRSVGSATAEGASTPAKGRGRNDRLRHANGRVVRRIIS
jgi:hypothetical protein